MGILPSTKSIPYERCSWAGDHTDYQDYHDTEWGFPVGDDRHLFEKLCLEGFQSGLSWLTILRKRENFRKAFADFDHSRIGRWTERSVARLLGDAGIIRPRGKIEATLNNARCASALHVRATRLDRRRAPLLARPSLRPLGAAAPPRGCPAARAPARADGTPHGPGDGRRAVGGTLPPQRRCDPGCGRELRVQIAADGVAYGP